MGFWDYGERGRDAAGLPENPATDRGADAEDIGHPATAVHVRRRFQEKKAKRRQKDQLMRARESRDCGRGRASPGCRRLH
jgi:hypothetical protein